MIKDLTSLKWKKNIYYVSDNVIFDIESKKKKFDIDCCGLYLVDAEGNDGSLLVLNPELYIDKVPYIVIEFSDGLKKYFPLQYLIEEGDRVENDSVILQHPNVFDNKYINKFNLEVYNFIRNSIKGKDTSNPKVLLSVMNLLPDWLTTSESLLMTEDYINKQFLKGLHYKETIATKGDTLYSFEGVKLGIGTELYQINIWTEEVVKEALKAIEIENVINKFSNKLSPKTMEYLADALKSSKGNPKSESLLTLLNVVYNDDSLDKVNFEIFSVEDNIDTYYEYKKSKDTTKYYSLIKDEESWNADAVGALNKYYIWSDLANAPYKEDLWNTTENRAANINDAKKENNEFVLDENGNYIYDGCIRCWQGAVNAPGAKYPWIVINFDKNVNSTITFKYTYPDGTVKEVKPWGDRVFGDLKIWGCASVASEFEDNDFLISENRTDGGQSTFDINRFELILNPVE